MKKILTIIISITTMTAVLLSCSPVKDEGEAKMLTFNLGSEPPSIDPAYSSVLSGSYVIKETFEGLVREMDQKIQPGIATHWETTENDTVITFYLRESNWSDGTPLTAHDFVYSWKRAINPKTASTAIDPWLHSNIIGVKEIIYDKADLDTLGVTAIDDYTLRVELTQPTGYFLQLMTLSNFMPVPEKAVTSNLDKAWASFKDTAITNGPFVLDSYEIGNKIVLKRNEHFWASDEVKLDGITLFFVEDEATAYTAYQQEELLVIPNMPKKMIPTIKAEHEDFYTFTGYGTLYFDFNLRQEIWSDVRIRKAINLAISRDDIVDALGSVEPAAFSFVSPGFTLNDGTDFNQTAGSYKLSNHQDNIAEAQALLAEAGYPNGEGFPEFDIYYNTKNSNQLIAEMIQEMLKDNLGLQTKLRHKEWTTYLVSRNQRDFTFSKGSWSADLADPVSLLSIFTTDHAKNASGYSNPEYDKLIEAGSAATGNERFRLFQNAEAILMEDLPFVPIHHYVDTWLINNSVTGWTISKGIIDFSRADITNE